MMLADRGLTEAGPCLVHGKMSHVFMGVAVKLVTVNSLEISK